MHRLITILLIIIFDQVTKWWVSATLSLGQSIAIFPGLRIRLAHNYGIAFSFFADNEGKNNLMLILSAVVITVGIIVWLCRLSRAQRLLSVALACVVGGAVGNLIDRIWHGYVIDFIDVYVGSTHWPTFNIADSFITLGALFALIAIWREK